MSTDSQDRGCIGRPREKSSDSALREREEVVRERDLARAQREYAIRERDAAFAQRNAAISQRDRAVEERDRIITAFITSNSWRMTAPLRAIRSVLLRSLTKRQIDGPSLEVATRSKEELIAPVRKSSADIEMIAEELSRRVSKDPVVSVVVPVCGHLEYTMQCLQSISGTPTRVPFELIVVDDRSLDETRAVLEGWECVSLLKNDDNQGFIRSCNRAAAVARGEILVFLNNDTLITREWLDELVGTFRNVPDAGIVGSKLLYPDGRLQEAGAIVWSDGSAWNYGRGCDPAAPEFNYLRKVDYCSGASLAIRRSLFEECGGFDEYYLPAYCEDSDLAFKVRRAGKGVYYQPLSVVHHYEGVSCGRDLSSGVKSSQARNMGKFLERWRAEVQFLEPTRDNGVLAKDRDIVGRVLVLDHTTPTPDQDAGSLATLNLMRVMQRHGYQVTFIPEDNMAYVPEYTPALQRIGIEVIHEPYCRSVKEHLDLRGQRYDAILIVRPTVAERHIRDLEDLCPAAKRIYLAADLHFLRMRREAEVTDSPATKEAAVSMEALELSVMRRCDAIIVHSTYEAQLLSDQYQMADVHVFEWAMEVRGTKIGFGQRQDICFVGSYGHPPNMDAVRYFVRDIFPLIRERLPAVRFYIVGSDPPAELRQLGGDRVIVTGFVKDLRAFLDCVRLAVAPLRFGAGTKGKISTSLAAGLPCVATSVAAEGMGLTDGLNVVLADSPEDFAAAVAELYNSEEAWESVSRGGLSFAKDTYSFDRAVRVVGNILMQIELPSGNENASTSNLRAYGNSFI